jgi:hypothetical protein
MQAAKYIQETLELWKFYFLNVISENHCSRVLGWLAGQYFLSTPKINYECYYITNQKDLKTA